MSHAKYFLLPVLSLTALFSLTAQALSIVVTTHPSAVIRINGDPTRSRGVQRVYEVPASLQVGKEYSYKFTSALKDEVLEKIVSFRFRADHPPIHVRFPHADWARPGEEVWGMISAGWDHACALDDDGVHCWGEGFQNVPELNHPRMVSAGGWHDCALDADGVKCWGAGGLGQTRVPRLRHPTAVVAAHDHSCALDDEGVKCWGVNFHHEIEVPPLSHPRMLSSSGGNYICAVDDFGVHCWGENYFGQCNPPALSNPRSIAAGFIHACALDDSGVQCWGEGRYGQTRVPPLRNPRAVGAGRDFSCALDDDGVKCWGYSKDGQTRVPPLKHPRALAVGGYQSCALDDDGVKCWGENDRKQLEPPPLFAFHFPAYRFRAELFKVGRGIKSPVTTFFAGLGGFVPERFESERDPFYQAFIPALEPVVASIPDGLLRLRISGYAKTLDRLRDTSPRWVAPTRESARLSWASIDETLRFLSRRGVREISLDEMGPFREIADRLGSRATPLSPDELAVGVEKIYERAPLLRSLYQAERSRPYVMFIGRLVEQLTGLVRPHLAGMLHHWASESYRGKAKLLHTAAELLETRGSSDGDPLAWLDKEEQLTRLFVWTAVGPLVELSQLERFRSEALPMYRQVLHHASGVLGVTRLKDIPATPTRIRTAQRLFAESLRSLEAGWAVAADGPKLRKLVALSGKAIATPDDPRVLEEWAASVRESTALFTEAAASVRLAPIAAMATTLGEYLGVSAAGIRPTSK